MDGFFKKAAAQVSRDIPLSNRSSDNQTCCMQALTYAIETIRALGGKEIRLAGSARPVA